MAAGDRLDEAPSEKGSRRPVAGVEGSRSKVPEALAEADRLRQRQRAARGSQTPDSVRVAPGSEMAAAPEAQTPFATV